MDSGFQEFNLFVYHSVQNQFYGAVIWCLGPYVDDEKQYGLRRKYLAVVTRYLCRAWLARVGQSQP